MKKVLIGFTLVVLVGVIGLAVMATHSIAAPPGGMDLVYIIPGSNNTGSLVEQAVNAQGALSGDRAQLATPVTSRASSNSHGVTEGTNRNLVVVNPSTVERRDLDSPLPLFQRLAGDGTEVTLVGSDGTFYEADGLRVIAHTTFGTKTYAVPAPTTGVPSLDGKPIKVDVRQGSGRVGGLAIGADGHLYAVVSNFVGALVADLTGGRQKPLAGIGATLGLVVGPDGQLHALAWDPSRSASTYAALRIDPVTLDVRSTAATSITPYDGAIDDLPQIITAAGFIWVYASQAAPASGAPHASLLFKIDMSNYRVTHVGVAGDAGSRISSDSSGNLLIYGGPARNVIHRFDPVSDRITSVASAPAGSFVLAVFPH